MEPQPRDTPEAMVANVCQVLLALLTLHPDSATIAVPREFIAQWYRDLSVVLVLLRARGWTIPEP
jgi:hypothetical protein